MTTKILENGFRYLDINNAHAHIKIALQGAHIFYYKPHHQQEVLWTSQTTLLQEGKAIRGGVPICWPWFGKHPSDPTLPQHGFARTSLWECTLLNDSDPNETKITLELSHNNETLKLWPYKFKLTLDIILNETLSLSLTTHNEHTKAFTITEALHSYFYVNDIKDMTIQGLESISYIDQLDNNTIKSSPLPISIKEEIDRAYINTQNNLTLEDKHRAISIIKEGSSSTVIWNPWIEKSKKMIDFHADGHQEMVCIETANVYENVIPVEIGESHTVSLTITIK